MERREFLKRSGCVVLGRSVLGSPLFASGAKAASALPVERLLSGLNKADGEVYRRQSGAEYERLLRFYNRRFDCVRPEVVVYCRSVRGVAKALAWCRDNGIAFSVRSGGHCFEGLSRSNQAIIDVRGLNAIGFKPREQTVHVGSGAALGEIYKTIAPAEQVFPGGVCPSIGIAGLVTGGGIGFFVRQLGLASDNLMSAEVVGADGEVIVADESSDLLWALRGAGQGSFGIITKMVLKTHNVPRIHTYLYEGTVPSRSAERFLARWQDWIGGAPTDVSSAVFLRKKSAGEIFVEVKGLTIGSEAAVRAGLGNILKELRPGARLALEKRNCAQTFAWFSEGENVSPVYEKGKSDIVKTVLGPREIRSLLDELPLSLDVEINGLGGAVNRLRWDQTAFPHRDDARLLIQWGVSWERPEHGARRLKEINEYYAKMRPLMSGAAYLNYADRDIRDPARAYWGGNLERLIEIKRKYDPGNLFQHALSVPLGPDRPPVEAATCS